MTETSILSVAAQLLTVGAAFSFLLAASYKVVATRGLAEALVQLGVPLRPAETASRWFWLFELTFAAVLMMDHSWMAKVMLFVVGVGFVVVGFRAWQLNDAIPCACFGAHVSKLGVRQVAVGAILIVAGLLRPQRGMVSDSVADGGVLLIVLVLVAFALRAVLARPLLQEMVVLRRLSQGEYPA